jgi:hypothetical protein
VADDDPKGGKAEAGLRTYRRMMSRSLKQAMDWGVIGCSESLGENKLTSQNGGLMKILFG